MPPRVTKKTPPGPGSKRAARGRAAVASANVQAQVQSEESRVKALEVEVKEEVRVVEGKRLVDVGKDMEHKDTEVKAAAAYGNSSAKSK